MLRLKDIDENNWRPDLSVADEQKGLVSDCNRLLARAYAYRYSRSYAFLICLDEMPIGMGLYYDFEPKQAYDLSQFFIDQRWQRKGYGSAALQLVLNKLRQDGKYDKVFLTYIEGNEAARQLYLKNGFTEGRQIDEEIFMERQL